MRTFESSLRHDPVSRPDARRAFREAPLAMLVATGFGAGLSPVVPGTAGSVVGLALAWCIAREVSSGLSPSVAAGVGLLMSGLAVSSIGVAASARACRALGRKDPGCVVIDEIAGQLLASAPVPLFAFVSPRGAWLAWALSFLAFRLFDIWKPGPVDRLQNLPGGWGVVMDDVAAGLLAAGTTAAACLLGLVRI
jgi:phosphatidylglycerophosphatase A